MIRGLPREVDIPTGTPQVLAHTHRGPPGFMKLRPSPDDIRNISRLGQEVSIIVGSDGSWLIFSRTGKVIGGGRL